ncbi:MAG: hypothetical protein IH585_06870 [Anaerolineaceae bacterium]|nr:hypothetical protein [Anaerolineaceae bacterium]
MEFTDNQDEIAKRALEGSIFLTGIAGSGKTTIGKIFLNYLLEKDIPGNKILVLVPQKSLGITYSEFLERIEYFNGNLPDIQTVSGISQKIIRLFWPIIAPQYKFKNPKLYPTFLNIESAQYFMAKVCEPFFEKNFFSTIKSEKPRILSQILDNLNKSALVGFPHEEIALRLKSAWSKESNHIIAYDEAQECANTFRDYCLEFNFIDFSLQYEIFNKIIHESFLIQQYLFNSYEYLIYDNCEEDTPVAHDLILEWLPRFKSALVIQDENAGFRTFLGADPTSAPRLSENCQELIEVQDSFITDPPIQEIISIYNKALSHQPIGLISDTGFKRLSFHHLKFYPDMIDLVVNQIDEKIKQGVDPGKIAILAPFVSNALRFQIQQRMNDNNIKLVTHRPSRSLREESITHSLISWTKLAYPEWGLSPSIYQFRTAITHSIGNMDPIRADLLSRIVLAKNDTFALRSMNDVRPEMLERITIQAIFQYQKIFTWLMNYQNNKSEVDVFLASFFGEILSQPGFGFHENYEGAEITGRLIESMQNFRKNTFSHFLKTGENWALDYITMLENGLISALYLQTWDLPPQDAVYLAPAHTFLMQNRPVEIQIWLDIGNMGWWQRLMQPLTQPYVLSRNWIDGTKWTDIHEYENNQKNLEKLISGLLRRCSGNLILHTTGYNESGDEQTGPLLKATQRILRTYHRQIGNKNV